MKRKIMRQAMGFAAVVTILVPFVSNADEAPTEPGRLLAEQGSDPGHVGCSACHQMNGAGQPAAGVPRLAGLAPSYIEQQLTFFATDKRAHPLMSRYAKMLSPQQRKDVAAYYGAQKTVAPPEMPELSPEVISAGQALFENGIKGTMVMPCSRCHGPKGQGMGSFAPALAGQSPAYIYEQLQLWRSGSQRDPAGKIMVMEAHGMSDTDMRKVGAYVSTLPKPSPAPVPAAKSGN